MGNRIKKIISFVTVAFVILISVDARALTPQEAFDKAKDKLKGARTVTASFRFNTGGKSYTGEFLSSGSKFYLGTNQSKNWYDGKDLWTYVVADSETTVFRPSQADLKDVNPLLYLNSAADYKVVGSKTKEKGKEKITLIPKSGSASVKSITLTLNDKSFLPEKIEIIPKSGGAITITISNMKLGSSIGDSKFTYPKSTYPKVKINDLR